MSGRVTSTATGLLAGLLLLSLVWVPAGKAGEFGLRVNDVSGLATPWPLVASLPFPEGEIADAAAIRIVSDDKEVPVQIDVAATWRDGSIRWALAGFTAAPSGQYRVEYGPDVSRAPRPAPLQMTRGADRSLLVDTGVATYEFPADKLLPDRAWLGSGNDRIPILDGSGDGAYLIDNRGRTARVAGAAADVATEVLKEGPGRVVLKRSGWYVTPAGERLARAEACFYLAAGSAFLRVTHSLIFTEDTNQVWVRDYGLQFGTPAPPERVVCALGQPGRETVRTVAAEGHEVFLLQDTYPHFAERESRGVIGRCVHGKDALLEEFPAAGDWACGEYAGHGLTAVLPWLAERFPKEIAVGPTGIRVALWSKRSGRELDFRTATLAKEYWQRWARKGRGTPGMEKLAKIPNNAQGASRTHDLWLLPHIGPFREESVKRAAFAAARIPLVLADPKWLCATEALGWPMHHKDPERFPEEETAIVETWERLLLPHRVFPMTGFINWGHNPYMSYFRRDGPWLASFRSYGNMSAYGLRRHVWSLFARSAERKYQGYGHRLNRLLGDFGIAHCDAPGKPEGAFTVVRAPIWLLPMYWGNQSKNYDMNSSSSDIGNWLMEYYLTGDEWSRDITVKIGESFKKRWNLDEARAWRKTSSFLALRKLVNLSMREWDADLLKMTKDLAHALIDMESQTGVRGDCMAYACAMYKDQRHLPTLYMYYREIGDELGKRAFLRILDHRYRFYRYPKSVSYQSAAAFACPIAYEMTGRDEYRRVLEQTVRDARNTFSPPLDELLSNFPDDPHDWPTLPKFGVSSHTHFFLGLPTAMKYLAERGRREERFPVLVKSMDATPSQALFLHRNGTDTGLSLFCVARERGDVPVDVFPYPVTSTSPPVPGVQIEREERIPAMVPITLKRPASPKVQHHIRVTVPSEAAPGWYVVSLRRNEPFVVLDATTDKVALFCPDGFWSAFAEVEGDGWAVTGQLTAARLGDWQPFYFRVPEGIENLEMFLGRQRNVRAPDGTVALAASPKHTGRLSIPVQGRAGVWSMEATSHERMAFARLLNVEPIVSYGSPDRLPDGVLCPPAEKPDAAGNAGSDLEFVPGISGEAVRLSGARVLRFPRGRKVDPGGYANFPHQQGTIEFWLKPNWSTHDIVLGRKDSYRTRSFVLGPHVHVGYRCGFRASQKIPYTDLIFELLGTFQGAEPFRPFLGARSLIGREEHQILRRGKWTHIACTWAFAEPKNLALDKPVLGDLKWPTRWRVFGPLDRDDPVLLEEVLNSLPDTIQVNGKSLSARTVVVKNTRYDFPRILRDEAAGRTAYVFLKLDSPADQEVTLGMGADWWMQAWVNGVLVHDTTKTANIHHPFSIWNHLINVRLRKGGNILAVRMIRGGGSTLALGGPQELRKRDPAAMEWEFAIFVNGRKLNDYRSPEKVRFLRVPSSKQVMTLATEGEEVVLGPLDGAIDLLRISEGVRYGQDFGPPTEAWATDANTRALFSFDGSLRGSSALSSESINAR